MAVKTAQTPGLDRLLVHIPVHWKDYELVDSGNGQKLERYGSHVFIRPEPQAMWSPVLSQRDWQSAHASFQPTGEESGGRWKFHTQVPRAWQMQYRALHFEVQTTGGRHLGVFPEQASQWDWIESMIQTAHRPVHVLNLFGYTGLATLAAAQAGAKVTHVDASKKSVQWARRNQALSGLLERPVRWIIDDALKFVQREQRRGVRYAGIILDPPKFGRGPKGEVWEFFQLFPRLLTACRQILAPKPLFVVITTYAIRASALSLHAALAEMLSGQTGIQETGELALQESSGNRRLGMAIFSRWQSASSR